MKKNLLKILSCFCMATVIMGGCGNNTKATLADGTVTIEEDQTTKESVEESTEDITKEPVEESVEEPVEEPAKDWFAEHGLVITPQGDFTFTTMGYDDSWNDVDTFEVKADAVITETTDGVEDGYKAVTMVWNIDVSASDEWGFWYWALSFDRYTGTVFAFDSSTQYTDYGETSSREGFVTIVNGEESYDVSVIDEDVNNYPIITKTITVTCPVDYDGVVFYIGYCDSEIDAAYGAIDLTARLYTLDEMPAYGDGYYYFSYSNE